ncbi:MAG: epimerase/dehydratase family WbfY-like protein [Osedax symbiont Rs2]|nr:MAG: epimerase/dehydratase family WbfY-like protein [Osedax symbiont Rs2]
MLNSFLQMSRFYKRMVSLFVDTLLLASSFWLSYWIRLDSSTPVQSTDHWLLLTFLTPLTLLAFIRLGLYRSVLRYVSFRVLLTVLCGVVFSTFILISSAFIFEIFLPRSTAILFFSITFILVGGIRLFFKMAVYKLNNLSTAVLIYGAGSSGRQLHLALNQSSEYSPVVYVDDDPKLANSIIQGIKVYPPSAIEFLVERYQIQKILLALPGVAKNRKKVVLNLLEALPCEILSVPSMVDLVSGNATIDELKEVSIDDLLGRVAVSPNTELMKKNIEGKVVLITGAGGSIGSELCRQILNLHPSSLILFDNSEFNLYAIDRELCRIVNELRNHTTIIPILGSVQNKSRLDLVFNKFKLDTIFHAAAYKHVPLVEFNVVEGIQNNVFGTLNCAQAAIDASVTSFVLISTDKAVRPTNVMGASKRIAELVLQALATEKHKTIFSMVRFGNVLGSSGSVVPLFRKQIATGGPVTVTHPEITRYFMTMPEAAELVIQAGAMGKGGEVFVLDMGESIKIADLATKMIHLSGYSVKNQQNPNGDICIEFSGLRPGEKLYEELLIGDDVTGTVHERILCAHEIMLSWKELNFVINDLEGACNNYDLVKIKNILLKAPAGFNPIDELRDLVCDINSTTQVHNIVEIKPGS